MAAPLALAPGLEKGGALLVAVAVAAAVLAGPARVRAWATLAAVVLTPALLVGQVADTSQWDVVRRHPGIAAVAALLGVVAVAGLAVLLRRRPGLFPLLAVGALPFRIPIDTGSGAANLLVPLYLVVGASAVGAALATLRAPEGAETPPTAAARRLQLVLLGFVVLYALQALYTKDLRAATDDLVFFLVPFALLFARLTEVRWTRRVVTGCLAVLAGLALVLVGIGFVEYATRTLLFNPKVIDANSFADYFRVNSLFFDPNIYGRFLALVMLAVATVLLWTRERRVALGGALVLAVLWGGLVLSFSQSSFAALLVGLAVLAGARWDPRRAALVAGALVVVGLVAVVVGQGALKLDLGSSSSVNRSTSGRLNLIKGGADMFADRPFLGWGSGAFPKVFRTRGRSRREAVSASHTIPLTVAAEQGIVGLLAYLALLAAAFALLVRRAREGPLRAFLLAGFAAVVVHTMVYAAFLEDPATWALLGVAAALPEGGSGGAARREPG